MRTYEIVVNGRTFAVEVQDITASRAKVKVDGTSYEVDIPASAGPAIPAAPAASIAPAATPAPTPAPSAPSGGSGDGNITAPMPGVVWEVPVKVGDSVEAGSTVIVIEAMKMENDVKTPISGTVKELPVGKGDEVAVGQTLVIVE